MSVFADMTDRHQPSIIDMNTFRRVFGDTPEEIAEKRKGIIDAVREYCTRVGVSGLPAQGVVDAALALWINGGSPAAATALGRKIADSLAPDAA